MITIDLEEEKNLLVIDCFTKIETVYLKWLDELNEAKKSKNDTIEFALKNTFSQENSIRNYIFERLKKFWYENFKKEVWTWKWRKDLIYTISNKKIDFIIEAKRLDWWVSLNTEYIKKWVNRFKNKDWVTDYSKDIKQNENIAWMLWFVIEEWKVSSIIKQIKSKIIENDKLDKIKDDYIISKENSFISENWYFTENKRIWDTFILYHYFIDFSEK